MEALVRFPAQSASADSLNLFHVYRQLEKTFHHIGLTWRLADAHMVYWIRRSLVPSPTSTKCLRTWQKLPESLPWSELAWSRKVVVGWWTHFGDLWPVWKDKVSNVVKQGFVVCCATSCDYCRTTGPNKFLKTLTLKKLIPRTHLWGWKEAYAWKQLHT